MVPVTKTVWKTFLSYKETCSAQWGWGFRFFPQRGRCSRCKKDSYTRGAYILVVFWWTHVLRKIVLIGSVEVWCSLKKKPQTSNNTLFYWLYREAMKSLPPNGNLCCSPIFFSHFKWFLLLLLLVVCVVVTQSCPTLCNAMDCSLSGSSVHRIL